MSKIELNGDLSLEVTDYDETEQAEVNNLVRDDDLTSWWGYGTLAGLRARATYLTTPGDERQVEEVGGDWGSIDWMERLHHVDIITDDHVPVVTIHNPGYSDSDDKYTSTWPQTLYWNFDGKLTADESDADATVAETLEFERVLNGSEAIYLGGDHADSYSRNHRRFAYVVTEDFTFQQYDSIAEIEE